VLLCPVKLGAELTNGCLELRRGKRGIVGSRPRTADQLGKLDGDVALHSQRIVLVNVRVNDVA